jgi:hypothetical protein
MQFYMLLERTRTICSLGLLTGILLLAGCDSTTGSGGETDTTFEGRVTDDVGFSKSADSVEGAVVTAANVSASGSTNQIEGEATTDAEGRFQLETQDAANEVILVAEKTDFRSKVMAYTDGRTAINTMPMTAETHGEADVFVEARRQDDDDDVTMSDVAVYVTHEFAAEASSDAEAATSIAAAIVAEARARKDYVREETGNEQAEEARDRENQAFLEFQADISASAGTSAQTDVVEAFESALIEAYSDAGVAIETQARARQAARAALVRFSSDVSSSARLHLRKQAEVLAALATSESIDASFRAGGATEARIDALEEAQSTFLAQLRTASSTAAIAEAKAQYEASLHEELAAEIGVDAGAIATADAALETAEIALELAVTTAASASAVAQAHASFYASAETAARTSLAESDDAELGASVLTLLSADVD